MKRLKLLVWCSSLLLVIALMNTSCSKKTGCPMNDPSAVGVKSGKKGKLSTKRGKTSLFPKKMKNKMKK